MSLGSCGDRRRADAEYSGISLFEMLQRLARLVVVSAVIPVDAFVTASRRHALFAKIPDAQCLLSVSVSLAECTNRCWHAETRCSHPTRCSPRRLEPQVGR